MTAPAGKRSGASLSIEEGLSAPAMSKLEDSEIPQTDPFELFEKLLSTEPKNMSPDHAFYLGYEMAKAVTAMTLGKQYQQDQALDWGMLTAPEQSHRSKKSKSDGEKGSDGDRRHQ